MTQVSFLFARAILLAGCAAKAVFHGASQPSAPTYFDPKPYLKGETARA